MLDAGPIVHEACGSYRQSLDDWKREIVMTHINRLLRTASASTALLGALAAISISAEPANAAVVYCKTAGVPQGCVMRTTPVARAVVTPGVGAPGVGVRPGTPMNRGGPVNRPGRR
jgi:hypothetical protein